MFFCLRERAESREERQKVNILFSLWKKNALRGTRARAFSFLLLSGSLSFSSFPLSTSKQKSKLERERLRKKHVCFVFAKTLFAVPLTPLSLSHSVSLVFSLSPLISLSNPLHALSPSHEHTLHSVSHG